MFFIVPESLDLAIDDIIRKAEPNDDPRDDKFLGIRCQLVAAFNERGSLADISIKPGCLSDHDKRSNAAKRGWKTRRAANAAFATE